jgi:DNA-binding YbaB/EbfC family protein
MAKGFGDMMKQARVLQEKMAKMQEELGDKIVESSVGGGMVVTKANGRQELLSIDLEPEVVDPNDIEMLQDLIVAAVNDVLKRSQEMAAEEMSKLTGGLKLPGGMKMPGMF